MDSISLSFPQDWRGMLMPAFLVVLITAIYFISNGRKAAPYPPGPPSNPIFGNLKDVPSKRAWLTYQKWGKIYGDILHLKLLSTHLIVLNSYDDVRELFEKRSQVYSDRPPVIMSRLMGWKRGTGSLCLGEEFRMHRQVAQQSIIKQSNLEEYLPAVTNKVNQLLRSLLMSPSGFMDHSKTFAVSVVMAVVYGYDVSGTDDHFVVLADEVLDKLTQAMLPSAAIVNILPVLRHLPSWFPGASFKRLAAAGNKLATEMREAPFFAAEKQTAEGIAAPSVVSNFIKKAQTSDYEVLKHACVGLYAGGTETSTIALTIFFYAMMAYPEVQTRARQEIIDVVGNDRLPTYADRPSLPYIDAIIKELLRWRPVLPLGLPHTTLQDDVHKGYLIPKGSMIFANIWAIHHNPQQYPEPDLFNPDRFIDGNGNLREDIDSYGFGFGRRICPGKNLAVHSLWLSIASILYAFDIHPPPSVSGECALPPLEYNEAMSPRPLPFGCSITPRSASKGIVEAINLA